MKHVTVNADQAVAADTVVAATTKAPVEGTNARGDSGPLLEACNAPSSPLQSAVRENTKRLIRALLREAKELDALV